ncbi:MAG: hypothetical protein OSB10_09530 [Planctomycetota bacterium]|nr:hypothetical protein [Planctomycetota bacterium]
MAFGQASGPPASHQQMNDLQELLERAGHSSFREARGPMGFTQRQAGGKFTRDEAQEFIDELEDDEDREAEAPQEAKPALRLAHEDRPLRDTPTTDLVSELQRRGWAVTRT